jgi:DivIVA domain-containing protein
MRRKKEHGEQARSSGDGRLTPAEIQQVEFRLAFRGYNERDVDAFLDRITEELSSYLDEINRLRSGVGASPAVAASASVGGSAAAGAGMDARAAMAPFLNREREFLQSLGGLVQGHAEEIKAMVLSLRGKAEAEARNPSTPSGARTHEAGSVAARQPAADAELEDAGSHPRPVARSEPVVLTDAVEPARAGESEPVSAERPSGERSLRDLFWGED